MSHSNNHGWSKVPFLALVACAALFVWISGRALPPVVASHFDASGRANGFMPHEAYVWFMLAIVAFVPLVMALLPIQAFRNPNARINLPNREYWLAPERRAETIEFLSGQSARFSSMLLVFLAYVHWLVVQANKSVPPHLSSQWLLAGLGMFFLATLVWLVSFIGRFRDVPR